MITQLVLVPLVIIVMVVIFTITKRHSIKSGNDSTFRFIRNAAFIFYITGLIFLTFIYGERDNLFVLDLEPNFYIIESICTMHYSINAHRALMNIFLFVPMGFIIFQYKCEKKKKFWIAPVIIGFLVPLIVETLQITLHRGAFQVDDLIHNTIGFFIGYLVARVLQSINNT